jgi:hypothetical protein
LKRLSHAEREKRCRRLEDNPFDWIKEIFGEEVECDFAAFQKKSILRIHFYYGEQAGVKWKESRFVTQGKVSFKALGAGQSPREKKNANVRTDIIIVDEFSILATIP